MVTAPAPPPPTKPNVKLTLQNMQQAATHCRNLLNTIKGKTEAEDKTIRYIADIIYQLIESTASSTIDGIEIREQYEKKNVSA